MPQSDVLILATGGTIDKLYSREGRLITGEPAARWLLESAGIAGAFDVEALLAKDSLDITDDDRMLLADRIGQIGSGGVVVTHGTDTMTETAEHLLASAAVQPGVTIVITGTMQPARMRDGDAAFNLGAAIAAAQVLTGGVWIAMSGRVFEAGAVEKDRAAGRFVPADGDAPSRRATVE